jgi:hypothetical protein
MEVISEENFLARKGVVYATSGYCLDKLRANRSLKTDKGRKRFFAECDAAEKEYQKKRQEAKEEYHHLCESGKIRPETNLERRLKAANGHPDNASTQAARRLLAKQGIDWKTGAKITSG